MPAALRLGRVSNLPTVWTNVLAGVVLSGGTTTRPRMAALGIALSLFYVGGMYLNDAFDREFDRKQRPERPIPSGEISAAKVFAAGFQMLGLGLLTIGVLSPGPLPLASAGILGALIVFYDAYHKQNPLSPLVMGLCRVGVYTTAALSVVPAFTWPLAYGAGALLCYLIGLTYVARQENLAEVKNLWPLAFLAAPFVYVAPVALRDPATAAAGLVLLAWVAYALSFLRRGHRSIPRAVVSLIAGISLLDALLICHQGRPLLAAAAAVGFVLTLFFQRYISGT
jgi:4-hydroxybenzoate polyprenyltransferase